MPGIRSYRSDPLGPCAVSLERHLNPEQPFPGAATGQSAAELHGVQLQPLATAAPGPGPARRAGEDQAAGLSVPLRPFLRNIRDQYAVMVS